MWGQISEERLDYSRVAVLIPCFNEADSIGNVVRDFRKSLPGAQVYVYDNNSTDETATLALAAGAVVRREPLQGKGNVVRRMFADIEVDIYVLVDGDGTYDAAAAMEMIKTLAAEKLDMVTGVRVTDITRAYRAGHRFGNAALTAIVNKVFDDRLSDMLSGYRVLSRRFVKSFPAASSGFEIETELSVHALQLRLPISEMATNYRDRPPGSVSKLRTYADGFRIFQTIFTLIKEERPLQFFCVLSLIMLVAGLIIGAPVVLDFLQTGLVPRLPSALLATGFVLTSMSLFTCGLLLDSVAKGRREIKRLAYLAIPVPPSQSKKDWSWTTVTAYGR